MVIRKQDESVDQLLRRFKKEIQNSGILLEYRNRQEFIGPAEKRRLKSEAARKRIKRQQKKYCD